MIERFRFSREQFLQPWVKEDERQLAVDVLVNFTIFLPYRIDLAPQYTFTSGIMIVAKPSVVRSRRGTHVLAVEKRETDAVVARQGNIQAIRPMKTASSRTFENHPKRCCATSSRKCTIDAPASSPVIVACPSASPRWKTAVKDSARTQARGTFT